MEAIFVDVKFKCVFSYFTSMILLRALAILSRLPYNYALAYELTIKLQLMDRILSDQEAPTNNAFLDILLKQQVSPVTC